MKKSDVNNEKYSGMNTFEIDKAIEEHQKKIKSLSLPVFIKFEKKNIKNVFDLFKEDKNNSKLFNQSLIVNPYIDIYKIPLNYKSKIEIEKQIINEVRILVYPNYLATGKLRIDYIQSDFYGNFLQNLIIINKPFTLFNIIKNTYSNNNNFDYSFIERRMTMVIRYLLCNQFIIFE